MNHKTSQMQMFCYQCQETAGCKGCTVSGVCGKKPEVAAMQDLLVYVTKGLASVTTQLRSEGTSIAPEISRMVSLNLFTTITNANFDLEMIKTRVTETLAVQRRTPLTDKRDFRASRSCALGGNRRTICGKSRFCRRSCNRTGGYPKPAGTDYLWTKGTCRIYKTC